MAGTGYDIGASLSGSSSSGASQSGATAQRGGGNYGGSSYGPGAVVFGASSVSPLAILGVGIALIFLVFLLFKEKRR